MSEEIKLPNILVTGTPGVGKTSFSMLLTDSLNDRLQSQSIGKQFLYINIGKLITENKLYTDWNEEFDVPEYDEDKVLNQIIPFMTQGGCVLDFHSSGFLPEDMIELAVLIRCDNTILYDRLKARNYSDKKIKENIECEIMEVTSEEVRDTFPENKILELRGEQVDDMSANLESVMNSLNLFTKI